MLQPPFFHEYGPEALNYGSLGMIMGHEIMHALDPARWGGFTRHRQVKKEYAKRALCLRRSHRSVLPPSGEQDESSDPTDSENLSDLVGTALAYAAFSSSAEEDRRLETFLRFGLRKHLAFLRARSPALVLEVPRPLYRNMVDNAVGERHRWTIILLTSLSVLLLGLLCCILLLPYLLTEQSPVMGDTTVRTLKT
ncbi:hypothetical protein MTO96_023869 [Rhipicephalus appendiculatus]